MGVEKRKQPLVPVGKRKQHLVVAEVGKRKKRQRRKPHRVVVGVLRSAVSVGNAIDRLFLENLHTCT